MNHTGVCGAGSPRTVRSSGLREGSSAVSVTEQILAQGRPFTLVAGCTPSRLIGASGGNIVLATH